MKYLFAIIAVFVAGVFLYSRLQPQPKEEIKLQAQVQTTFSAQSSSEGSVTIKVTPISFSGDIWKFNVVLDTHSDELDQDLTKNITLKDPVGNIYQPTAWEGSPLGGHHREGQLSFNTITPKPDSISLIVTNIGGIDARTFLWEVGGE